MSADASRGQVPDSAQDVRHVCNVRVHDGLLVWAGSRAQDRVGLDQVLLVLDLAAAASSQPGFLILCLRDEAEDPAAGPLPHQLLALRADAVPEQLPPRIRLASMSPHLRCSAANPVDVVVSTGSGLGRAAAFWHRVLQPLWRLVDAALAPPGPSREPDVLVTRDAHSLRRFARSVWAHQPAVRARTVVLLSGDGAVVDLLNGDREDQPQPAAAPAAPPPVLVALIPLGTANALFHSLHRPLDTGPSPLVLAVRTLFLGTAAILPVFRASFSPGARIVSPAPHPSLGDGHDGGGGGGGGGDCGSPVDSLYGAIVASYGFHATLVHESDTPAYRRHGSARFAMVAQDLLRGSHPYRASLSLRRPPPAVEPSAVAAHAASLPPPPPALDVVDPAQTHNYILATLVSNLERTFVISPASRPLDNRLRLVHLADIGGPRTMEVMTAAYDGGKHVDMAWQDGQRVHYDEVEALEVQAHDDDSRWRKFCVDGTIVEVPRGGSMAVEKVQGAMLHVLVDSRVKEDSLSPGHG